MILIGGDEQIQGIGSGRQSIKELWAEVRNIAQEVVNKTILKKKK